MIFNVILEMLNILIQTILGILPNMPAIPTFVENITTSFIGILQYGVFWLYFLIGRPFTLAFIPLFILLVNFNWIYHSALWIIKKLPIGVH